MTQYQQIVQGVRGEGLADVARRVGQIGDVTIPSDATDAEVLALLSENLTEVVAAAGYTVHASVEAATTEDITLSGEQTIDTVVNPATVLVKNQDDAAENGLYDTGAGAWTRRTDFDGAGEAVTGSYVLVAGGTQAGGWVLTTEGTITIGTTPQTWRRFSVSNEGLRAELGSDGGVGLVRHAAMAIEVFADIATATIPAIVMGFSVLGYWAVYDGGAAGLRRVSSEPSHAGKTLSADGACWEIADATIKPRMLGAKGDTTEGSDGAVMATDATFTSAGAAFTSADIGKRISIAGAGTAGAVHITTIASINSGTSVELTLAAVTTVSGAVYAYGTDDTTAIANAIGVGRNIDFDWGDYLVSAKITVANAGQRLFASGYPRVTGVDNRAARIVVDNPTLDYVFHCTQTNNTFRGFRISASHTTTAEPVLFERASGSASDIDSRLIDMSFEGLAAGGKVVGRGLHVRGCEFGNMARGVALDWPASWTPNGQSNDLQETAARSYVFENNLFHGVSTWVTNTGANAQNVRSIIMSGNEGDIGGVIFSGVLVDSVIVAAISNINASTSNAIDLHAGSRNSTLSGLRFGGIIEGAADRTSNNCLKIATTTSNTTRDLQFLGCSFGPCERDGIQIYGDGEALGLKFLGGGIDRPCQTTGGGYTPISIFNSGGTLTKVELSVIGMSIDMAGTDSATVIGGTNSGAIEVHWFGNQVRNFPTAPLAIAQSAVNVFQDGGEVNPKYTQFARKNGTWATDGTEWLYRMEAKTMDVSGGGVGIAGSVTLRPVTSLASSTFWRFSASSTIARDVGVLDLSTGGLVPVTDNVLGLGSAALRYAESYVVLRRWTATVFDSAGSGSPEGVVTAGIGSTYRRTNGGAATSFYVKESGTGNTGWVAK